MRCPRCHRDDNLVLRTRSHQNFLADGNTRVRLCKCGHRFATMETVLAAEAARDGGPSRAFDHPAAHAAPPLRLVVSQGRTA